MRNSCRLCACRFTADQVTIMKYRMQHKFHEQSLTQERFILVADGCVHDV